ncbi:MAG: hypothetical protein C4562_05525 [Actinobacteria bacterium]|nr:MAG: hypothetical protein C4562_05525 [Actinomycetota bacterium]
MACFPQFVDELWISLHALLSLVFLVISGGGYSHKCSGELYSCAFVGLCVAGCFFGKVFQQRMGG